MLFFPAGWESVDASTVLGKLDCMDMAVHWREKLSISYLAVTELLANLVPHVFVNSYLAWSQSVQSSTCNSW